MKILIRWYKQLCTVLALIECLRVTKEGGYAISNIGLRVFLVR